MKFWTARQIQEAVRGRWLAEPSDVDAPLTGVSIDSRTIEPGQVFVAIAGERFDGHDFVEQAAARGAGLCIVSREICAKPQAGALIVEDTVAALQALARVWRTVLREVGVKVVAVTGSNGKTTTRELIHTVLSASMRGTQSPKSFNNHLGVPLTLLGGRTEDDFVVAEVGTNHPGEIAALAGILEPDAAVITTIGSAHIEYFGSIEAIAREKGSLLRFVTPGGCAVWPAHVEGEAQIAEQISPQVTSVRFGEADLRGPIRCDDATVHFTLADGVEVALPLLGEHNVYNALAAIAVGRYLGVEPSQAATALGAMQQPTMRLQRTQVGEGANAITLINDAYNANPQSVRAALDVVAQLGRQSQGRRCVVVLGDMLELGETGPDEHRRIGEAVAQLGDVIAMAVLVGRLSMFTAESLSRHWTGDRIMWEPQWSDDLPQRVAAMLRGGDIVLLKASRGMALERIVPAIGDKLETVEGGR